MLRIWILIAIFSLTASSAVKFHWENTNDPNRRIVRFEGKVFQQRADIIRMTQNLQKAKIHTSINILGSGFSVTKPPNRTWQQVEAIMRDDNTPSTKSIKTRK